MSTSSSRKLTEPPRAIVVGPARVGARRSIPGVRRVSSLQRPLREEWPAPALLLFDLPRPTAALAADLERLKARWRDTRCFVIGSGRNVATRSRSWSGLVLGALPGPLSIELLDSLAALDTVSQGPRAGRGTAERRIVALEERLALMSDTTQAAGSLLDPGMASRFIMERAAALVGSTRWRLYRVDEQASALRLEAALEPPDSGGESLIPLDRGVAGWVARHRELVQIERPERDERIDRALEWPHGCPQGLLLFPLISRGRVIAVAQLADPQRTLEWRERGLLTALLDPAAIALDNAMLFRRLEERTVTDDLTHLYNARFMENYLRRETKRAQRFNRPVSLLFIDLDGFKAVNDAYGHMAGSRTLVEVGEILRRNVRELDIVARWGGDEFGVVLTETGLEGALVMAERIRKRICEGPYLEGTRCVIDISASIGVAVWPEHGRSAEELLAAADAAMYRVKDRGKNGVLSAEELLESTHTPRF